MTLQNHINMYLYKLYASSCIHAALVYAWAVEDGPELDGSVMLCFGYSLTWQVDLVKHSLAKPIQTAI
jgi:hypothetical protein